MTLEQRITALEKENAELKRQLEDRPKNRDYIKYIVCTCGKSNHYADANFCTNCGKTLD